MGNSEVAVSASNSRFVPNFLSWRVCRIWDLSLAGIFQCWRKKYQCDWQLYGEKNIFRAVFVFVFGRGFLVFCSKSCICFGFLFGVFLLLFSECTAMCGPMCETNVSVIGIIIGWVVVSCCVSILSRPWFWCWLISVVCTCGLGTCWGFLFWHKKGWAVS